MDLNAIRAWQAPTWHPDCGDPSIELEMLRDAALLLLSSCPELTAHLDCFEAGYMHVILKENGLPYATLLVTSDESPKLAWFADRESMPDEAQEQYFEDADALVSWYKCKFL